MKKKIKAIKNVLTKKKNTVSASTSGAKKNTKFYSVEKLQEMISVKAYELYTARNSESGDATSDWLKAEKLVKRQLGINS